MGSRSCPIRHAAHRSWSPTLVIGNHYVPDVFGSTILLIASIGLARGRAAPHMRTTMVLDALEMARWSRGTRLDGLRCHSDAGSQFTSVPYGERLAEIGAVPSIGTVGDSYD
jgi:transposase InsO family protein